MKPCIIIPCFDHATTVAAVAGAARAHGPVYVVDDGSVLPLPEMPGVTVIRLAQNSGKGAALRAGFQRAAAAGFTTRSPWTRTASIHPMTCRSFLRWRRRSRAFMVGVVIFMRRAVLRSLRRSNAVSSSSVPGVETGIRLGDTQCGFRCYPLALTQKMRARAERYAFELEFMVRAAWTGTPVVAVPVQCSYSPEQMRRSHFRPVIDLALITTMNIGLVLQSWFVPRALRTAWSFGERRTFRQVIRDFFAEHAHEPARLACAVGLGLFCGIAPIWGLQMVTAATLAHLLRLNKAVTLLASNISIPPFGAALHLRRPAARPLALHRPGRWSCPRGRWTYAHAREFAWRFLREWCVGSVCLGALVATMGTVMTYGVAKFWQHR